MDIIRIIIADPLELIVEGVRSWLQSWLQKEQRFAVVGHAHTGIELLELLRTMPCDLVLLEVSLPDMDGIDTMRSIHRTHPHLHVLGFSSLTEIEYVNSMLIEGASGYLVKGGPREEMISAMCAAMVGERYVSEAAQRNVEKGYTYTNKRPEGAYVGLTVRERQIIRLIALEHTNDEIAGAMHISAATVKTHRKALMTKLNVRSTAGLVKYALDRRWA